MKITKKGLLNTIEYLGNEIQNLTTGLVSSNQNIHGEIKRLSDKLNQEKENRHKLALEVFLLKGEKPKFKVGDEVYYIPRGYHAKAKLFSVQKVYENPVKVQNQNIIPYTWKYGLFDGDMGTADHIPEYDIVEATDEHKVKFGDMSKVDYEKKYPEVDIDATLEKL